MGTPPCLLLFSIHCGARRHPAPLTHSTSGRPSSCTCSVWALRLLLVLPVLGLVSTLALLTVAAG